MSRAIHNERTINTHISRLFSLTEFNVSVYMSLSISANIVLGVDLIS